jgi:hypothetical protein
VRRDDEDDRSGDSSRAWGDPSWIDGLVVPDDISELDGEVRAWQRERRARQRRERLRRLGSDRRIAMPAMIVALLLVAGVAGLLLVFQPRRSSTQPAPLATSGLGAVGRVRGLLPEVNLRLPDDSSHPVRDYRPAVLALSPVGCGCDAALRDAGQAALRYQVPFLLIDRGIPPLPAALAQTGALRAAEPTGTLARTYGAEQSGRRLPGEPVLVLVRSDGEVTRVLHQPTSERALGAELAVLASTGGAAR